MTDNSTSQQLMLIIICVVFYFAPTFNASSRKHPAKASIFLLNLFLGWTLVGWVVSLVWSASPKKQPVVVSAEEIAPAGPDKYQSLDRLGSLKDRGLITDEEYQVEKTKILNS